jgi:steroid delta-isomerase-like uncharacterized protein
MRHSEAERSKDAVRPFVDAINRRNFLALDALLAADVRRHSGATPGVMVENRDQFKAFLEQDIAAVPDSRQEIDFMFADGDFVAIRMLYLGTQRGPWGSFPPSDRGLELPVVGTIRVENGRIAEIWV